MNELQTTSTARERIEPKVDHVVVLVHGIRTNAPWQITLRSELESCGVRVELTNYGYFDIFRFLIPLKSVRERAITRVWTSIRDIRRIYPRAKVSFLAHSFGTFILAQILRKEFDFKAHRLVFCGSIVPYDFPFHEISERFSSPLINEVGSADFLPALAESVTWGYGSAGTYGFRGPRVTDRWHNKLGHSDFLTPEFCARFWVPFFATGKVVEADNTPEVPPLYVRLISRIKLRSLILLALLAFVWVSSTSIFENFRKMGTITITDAVTTVRVRPFEGPPPEKKPLDLVVNSIDFLVKNETGATFKRCAYLFLEDKSLIAPYLHPGEFTGPTRGGTLRQKFEILFLSATPFPLKKLRFRITCDGISSNMISADVYDQLDWARSIKPWPKE